MIEAKYFQEFENNDKEEIIKYPKSGLPTTRPRNQPKWLAKVALSVSHGDTSVTLTMAPFRDELSHGRWFRELLQ